MDIKKWLNGSIIYPKLIITIKVNINAESDDAFRLSCENGHKEMAEWLYNLSKTDNNIKVNINAESDICI